MKLLNRLKNIGIWLAMSFITILWIIAVIIDRVLMAFLFWRDLPGANEIEKFDHEKDELSKRLGIYVILIILYGIYWNIANYQLLLKLIVQ